MRRSPIAALLAAACVALAACSGPAAPSATAPVASGTACGTAPAPADLSAWGGTTTSKSVIPVLIANPGELICGANRVLFSFIDDSNRPIGSPDRSASVTIYDLGRDPGKAIQSADATFVWAIENDRGIYVANLTFPEAGTYGLELKTQLGSATPDKMRLTFDVQPSSGVVKVGDKAPATKTPTLADAGGDATKISTDPSPDPALYQTSVDQDLAAHKPFVVVFATPKFCTTAQCGPTLDRIKPFVARYPGVAFIHVEPYKLKLEHGTLQADLDSASQLQQTNVTAAWGLLSEPWVFVVDKDGIVRASFELIFSDAELTAALDAVK
ncbi:MAG: hypothetical protein HY263_05545 [Chloroflexi bacterium]|nr:hypothetical protein [Chloroflexota bacterium]